MILALLYIKLRSPEIYLSGKNKIQMGVLEDGPSKYAGGDYIFDAGFEKVPAVFRQRALDIWNLIDIGEASE